MINLTRIFYICIIYVSVSLNMIDLLINKTQVIKGIFYWQELSIAANLNTRSTNHHNQMYINTWI